MNYLAAVFSACILIAYALAKRREALISSQYFKLNPFAKASYFIILLAPALTAIAQKNKILRFSLASVVIQDYSPTDVILESQIHLNRTIWLG